MIEFNRTINKNNFKFGVVHADCLTLDWNLIEKTSQGDIENVMWSRDKIKRASKGVFYKDMKIKNIDFVISGHSIVRHPYRISNHYFIDTGSYLKNSSVSVFNADDFVDDSKFISANVSTTS